MNRLKRILALAGALLLACTGFLCRILGFFYRIYLSRTIGAEGLGLYNMVHPVFGICFALCAGSIQTAVSQCVAANMKKGRTIFLSGAAALEVCGRFGLPAPAESDVLMEKCKHILGHNTVREHFDNAREFARTIGNQIEQHLPKQQYHARDVRGKDERG